MCIRLICVVLVRLGSVDLGQTLTEMLLRMAVVMDKMDLIMIKMEATIAKMTLMVTLVCLITQELKLCFNRLWNSLYRFKAVLRETLMLRVKILKEVDLSAAS